MEIKIDTSSGICEAAVEGELTIYHVGEFKKELDRILKKATGVALNLARVSEIDTSCFQLLMQAQDACLENNKEFRLASVSPAVREVMEIFGMERHFGDLD